MIVIFVLWTAHGAGSASVLDAGGADYFVIYGGAVAMGALVGISLGRAISDVADM